MKRRWIAAVWVTAATIPAAIVAVFVFGCCVLPFHKALHRIAPLCAIAVNLGGSEKQDEPSSPAGPKQTDDSRAQVQMPRARARALAASVVPVAFVPEVLTASHRNVISAGALRCDDDVGLTLLLTVFRI